MGSLNGVSQGRTSARRASLDVDRDVVVDELAGQRGAEVLRVVEEKKVKNDAVSGRFRSVDIPDDRADDARWNKARSAVRGKVEKMGSARFNYDLTGDSAIRSGVPDTALHSVFGRLKYEDTKYVGYVDKTRYSKRLLLKKDVSWHSERAEALKFIFDNSTKVQLNGALKSFFNANESLIKGYIKAVDSGDIGRVNRFMKVNSKNFVRYDGVLGAARALLRAKNAMLNVTGKSLDELLQSEVIVLKVGSRKSEVLLGGVSDRSVRKKGNGSRKVGGGDSSRKKMSKQMKSKKMKSKKSVEDGEGSGVVNYLTGIVKGGDYGKSEVDAGSDERVGGAKSIGSAIEDTVDAVSSVVRDTASDESAGGVERKPEKKEKYDSKGALLSAGLSAIASWFDSSAPAPAPVSPAPAPDSPASAPDSPASAPDSPASAIESRNLNEGTSLGAGDLYSVGKNGKFILMKKNDSKLVALDGGRSDVEFDEITAFANGFAVVKKDGKKNFIDINGDMFKTAFMKGGVDEAFAFDDGFAMVEKDNKFYFIDKQGEKLDVDFVKDGFDALVNGWSDNPKNQATVKINRIEIVLVKDGSGTVKPKLFDDLERAQKGLKEVKAKAEKSGVLTEDRKREIMNELDDKIDNTNTIELDYPKHELQYLFRHNDKLKAFTGKITLKGKTKNLLTNVRGFDFSELSPKSTLILPNFENNMDIRENYPLIEYRGTLDLRTVANFSKATELLQYSVAKKLILGMEHVWDVEAEAMAVTSAGEFYLPNLVSETEAFSDGSNNSLSILDGSTSTSTLTKGRNGSDEYKTWTNNDYATNKSSIDTAKTTALNDIDTFSTSIKSDVEDTNTKEIKLTETDKYKLNYILQQDYMKGFEGTITLSVDSAQDLHFANLNPKSTLKFALGKFIKIDDDADWSLAEYRGALDLSHIKDFRDAQYFLKNSVSRELTLGMKLITDGSDGGSSIAHWLRYTGAQKIVLPAFNGNVDRVESPHPGDYIQPVGMVYFQNNSLSVLTKNNSNISLEKNNNYYRVWINKNAKALKDAEDSLKKNEKAFDDMSEKYVPFVDSKGEIYDVFLEEYNILKGLGKVSLDLYNTTDFYNETYQKIEALSSDFNGVVDERFDVFTFLKKLEVENAKSIEFLPDLVTHLKTKAFVDFRDFLQLDYVYEGGDYVNVPAASTTTIPIMIGMKVLNVNTAQADVLSEIHYSKTNNIYGIKVDDSGNVTEIVCSNSVDLNLSKSNFPKLKNGNDI